MVKKWEEKSEKTLLSTRVFSLKERQTTNPRTGFELPAYVLEADDWVNVIPIADDGTIVVVRQYRHGTRQVTLEIPGGVVEKGEDPRDGGARELLEETGFEAGSMELLGLVHPNPAIQTNATYTFLATGLKKVSELNLDQAEDIEVAHMSLDEMRESIRAGEVSHSLVVAAFYWLEQRLDLSRKMSKLVDDLADKQTDKVAAMAKRINSGLTAEDLRNPQDFPDLAADPDFNYQDGALSGIESVRAGLRSLLKGSVLG